MSEPESQRYELDRLRFRFGLIVSWPLWALSCLGDRALRLHDRIVKWSQVAHDVP